MMDTLLEKPIISGNNKKKYDHGDCGEVRPLKK
jgi:hypothetical protein